MRAPLFAAIVLLAPALARAQPSDPSARAEALFNEGKALMEKGSALEACPKFAESMRLQPGIGVALWLGDCYERDGKTASAWAAFREAESLARARADAARQRVAEERVTALAAKLSTLLVAADRVPADAVIKRDALVLDRASLGTAVPVDPGAHTVEAQAPGYVGWSKTVYVPGDAARVRVDVPALAPVAPAQVTREEAADPGKTRRILAVSVAAAGVVALGAGLFFGLRARSAYDDSNANGHCLGDACDASGLSLRDDAYGRATASTVAFTIGAVALAAGAVLWFTAPKAR